MLYETLYIPHSTKLTHYTKPKPTILSFFFTHKQWLQLSLSSFLSFSSFLHCLHQSTEKRATSWLKNSICTRILNSTFLSQTMILLMMNLKFLNPSLLRNGCRYMFLVIRVQLLPTWLTTRDIFDFNIP